MADSNTYSFRTALQGFNRADVVHFIEQNTAAHEAELRQLQLENSRLAPAAQRRQRLYWPIAADGRVPAASACRPSRCAGSRSCRP